MPYKNTDISRDKTMKRSLIVLLLGVSEIVAAQSAPVTADFSIEQFYVGGRRGGEFVVRDRLTRASFSAETGAWRFNASHFYYGFCKFQEVDATNLEYSSGSLRLRAGRFLVPIGQTSWDEQWYSGHVFLNQVELSRYGGFAFMWHTSVGVDATLYCGRQTLQFSAVSSDQLKNRLVASKLDRGTVRIQHYENGVVYGLSALFNLDGIAQDERMLLVDVRWSVPQWGARAELVGFSKDGEKSNGYFVELYHRPKGWTDVTLVGRHEKFESTKSGPTRTMEANNLGVKLRGLFDTQLFVNYTFGPSMNNLYLGGGWAIQVNKTIRF